ncbi:MAG: hypothetical protein HKM03_05470 [Steroidobacteraceae bacterium]|nr:hypothetical protein [Steroidobacteraceae bacterium]
MSNSLRRLALAATLVTATGANVGAGTVSSSARFGVAVTVQAVARLEQVSNPAFLSISATDLRHGYVDTSTPIGVRVKSNSPAGFALDVIPVMPIAASIEIHGLDADVALGPDGGTIIERWQRPQERRLQFSMRFNLVPGLRAGDYPWPIRLAVRPL